MQQAAFISPAARTAIKKELLKTVSPEKAKIILNKLDNGVVKLADAEVSLLQKVGDAIKNTPNKQGGFVKIPGVKATNIHPEDVKVIKKFIDSTRIGKDLTDAEFTKIEKLEMRKHD